MNQTTCHTESLSCRACSKPGLSSRLQRIPARVIHRRITLFIISGFLIISCSNPSRAPEKERAVTPSRISFNDSDTIIDISEFGGVFSFGEDAHSEATGSLTIYPVTDSTALFYLDVCNGAPAYNMGSTVGEIVLKGGEGIYYSKKYDDFFDCILRFKLHGDSLWITTDSNHGDCGFGARVTADHTYVRQGRKIPDYFVTSNGKKLFFKEIDVYNYYD